MVSLAVHIAAFLFLAWVAICVLELVIEILIKIFN